METRTLGRTGLAVSVLGFGASHIGSDQCHETEAERVLNTVLDSGVSLLDTARGYGSSEERIGRFLRHRRSEFVLSTKGGYGVDGVPDWTPECIRSGIEQALQRMRTDCVDIFHLHSCPAETLLHSGVVEELIRAREAGKIRAAAYSGENADRACALGLGVFDVIQTSVNLCDQRVLDEALPITGRDAVGVIAKRPIANAFWRHAQRPVGEYCEEYWVRQQAMGLDPGDLDWAEFALRFTAFQPGVHSCIVGTASLDNLRRNIGYAGRGPLPTGVVESIRKRFRECDHGWTGEV
jgi:aryl-alcohol dehydrogenase-like predicted oxidoreductase